MYIIEITIGHSEVSVINVTCQSNLQLIEITLLAILKPFLYQIQILVRLYLYYMQIQQILANRLSKLGMLVLTYYSKMSISSINKQEFSNAPEFVCLIDVAMRLLSKQTEVNVIKVTSVTKLNSIKIIIFFLLKMRKQKGNQKTVQVFKNLTLLQLSK